MIFDLLKDGLKIEKMCIFSPQKKGKKTNVSFAFTHTYTLKKLHFFPKFWCGCSRQFEFSRCTPETGRFGRFSGPGGPKWNIHFLHLTQKERCTGQAECTQGTLFPYEYWVFEEKTRFGPVSGLPGPKRVSGNCRKWQKATGRNCVAGPFMHES